MTATKITLTPPDWLDAEAKKQFTDTVQRLDQLGTLRSADAQLIEAYAQAMSDYIRYTLELRRDGEVTKSARGTLIADPRCALRGIAHRQILAACRSLGMTPVDKLRARKEPVKGKNPFLQDRPAS